MALDFHKFQADVKSAAKRTFLRFQQREGIEKIEGYALYTDSSVMTLCSAVNTDYHLKSMIDSDPDKEPDDDVYYRWSTADWCFEAEDRRELDAISLTLAREARLVVDSEEFEAFRENVYEACVGALESLVNEGFFQSPGKDPAIAFAVSDTDLGEKEVEWIERLNSPSASKEFELWFESNA
ncbi:DUF4303 domain-containing protein [Baaleninema simplex]|uniref:DUF4303 domain-containing protein n=1 Tax=Baaleninema simplex TaxID=2862350 RepID=UPI000362E7EF|nr:DUF4303 domain-containing protein [Baaleninema simplex]